jgi:hypothetical protein
MRIKLLLAGIAELSLALLFGCSIVATRSFIVAVTPEEALRKGYPPMPAHWEAVVLDKGFNYPWLRLQDHPFLFALSVIIFFIIGFGLTWVQRRWTFQLGKRPYEPIAAPTGNAALLIALFVFSSIVVSALTGMPHLRIPEPAALGASSFIAVVLFRLFGGKLDLLWKTRESK